MNTPIYLDYNATTPIDSEVADEMKPFLADYFGNPSSSHSFGIKTKIAVENARKQLAELINCNSSEIIFTSGGTEANNYAIKGISFANKHRGNHIITTQIEHPAVIEVCKYLEKTGFSVTYLPVDEFGLVNVNDIKKAISSKTILITVMHANNEVGTIQPVSEIAALAKQNNIIFHSDAAQSIGKIKIDVQKMGVDLMSIAGHKFYAPKGIGALYIKQGVKLEKLIHGANHEQNLRAGTENVLEIVGIGKAAEIAKRNFENNFSHMKTLRDKLFDGLKNDIQNIKLNGHPTKRLPNTLSVSFPNIEANTLLSEISEQVAASAGAACHTDDIAVSATLEAMKIPIKYAMGTIRFSTGKNLKSKDIDKAINITTKAVKRLSPTQNPINMNLEEKEIKLTQYAQGMGCACKIRPQELEKILKKLPVITNPNILVGTDTTDDAAIYKIDDEKAVVQTVDFFSPIVDDPYSFGAISAANSISDIYAMGAKPLFALNIVGFPTKRLPMSVLEEILKGAQDKAQEAGIYILGGHSVDDTEPKYGMTVTGIINIKDILTNANAKPGDAIILTKPIGTGIISNATKRGLADEETKKEAIDTMSQLNKYAADVMNEFPVNSCTDVTGFGLLGHLSEMTKSSKINAEVFFENVPLLKNVWDYAVSNLIPGGSINNLEYVKDYVVWNDDITETKKNVLCDAQTSGGLLISLPLEYKNKIIDKLHSSGLIRASHIGNFLNKGRGEIFVKNN
ncbi:MAG: selenide, water dikinase SelD [Bacteroidetes bacterium]|nr:MAG: selenide, water dikinase SelD [Bacteroidota bacterium]